MSRVYKVRLFRKHAGLLATPELFISLAHGAPASRAALRTLGQVRTGLGRDLRPMLSALALSLMACGYEPAYGGARPARQLTVAVAPSLAPESGALAALLSGVRGELSQAGVLRPGTGYPRAVLELLRVDEHGAGIAVQPGQPRATPLSRGSTVGVMARAWIEDSRGAKPYHDTGDVRRVSTVATGTTLATDALAHDAAIEQAGLATGQAIGRRLVGEVEPTLEPL